MKAMALRSDRTGAVWLIFISLAYVQSVLFLHHGLSIDAKISNAFFDFTCQSENARACWLLDKTDKRLTFFLHDLPIHIFTGLGIFALCGLLASFKLGNLKKYRELAILILAGLILVPGTVAVLKFVTGHYCPGQLAAYKGILGKASGARPYPACFPAAFPAAGFGLLVLYFGSSSPLWRRVGLTCGLGLGGISSIIQIARGEHYFSHCIATLLTGLFIGTVVLTIKKYLQVRLTATGEAG